MNLSAMMQNLPPFRNNTEPQKCFILKAGRNPIDFEQKAPDFKTGFFFFLQNGVPATFCKISWAYMKRIDLTKARLALPRLLNDVELVPENDPVNFDIGSVVIKKNDRTDEGLMIAVGLSVAGKTGTFACLFLTAEAAKELGQELLKVSD